MVNYGNLDNSSCISFYVAECSEFPVLGEFHHDLTLDEAFRVYDQIPGNRMNGIKSIGFNLQDGSDYEGLRRIRNLGSKSETEIIEKVNEYRNLCETNTPSIEKKKVTIIKPAKKIWDRGIEEFNLSQFALTKLKSCGVNKVKDLYTTNPSNEPGWYAVRELFEKIPSCR